MPQIRQSVLFRNPIYYMHRGDELIILLVGGDKASQARDILRARQMIEQLDSRQ